MESSAISRNGKYLTFMLANEEYGIPIIKVKEIIGMMDITEMPIMPAYMKGVINLRDHIIPIVDLRNKFAMPPVDYTEKTCIIVTEIQHTEHNTQPDKAVSTIGIIVDAVSEVANIREEQTEDPPHFSDEVDTRFILGMAKLDGGVKILLDIDKALSATELAALSMDC